MFPYFGTQKAEALAPVTRLTEALRMSQSKTLPSYDTQLLLREMYDTEFGIANHSDARRPLSLVAMQPKETVGPYSRMYRVYNRFAALRVGELFNLSITEFLQSPREMVELMFNIAEKRTQADTQAASAIDRALAQSGHGPGGKAPI